MTVKLPKDDGRRETVENLRHLSHVNRVRHKEESYELLDETVMEPDIGYHEMNDVSECPVCGCRVGDEGHYHVGGTWNFCPQC